MRKAKIQNRTHRLLYTLGLTYLDRGQFAEAQEKFTQLLRFDPDNPDVKLNLSLAAIGCHDVSPEALAVYESAVAVHPDSEKLTSGLVNLFTQQEVSTPFAREICSNSLIKSASETKPTQTVFQENNPTPILDDQLPDQKSTAVATVEKIDSTFVTLEKFWWAGEFAGALDFLQKNQFTNKNYNRDLALTYVYESLTNKVCVDDQSKIDTIGTVLEGISPADSQSDLRNYLTMRLALPDAFHYKRNTFFDFQEHEFILGLIPMEDYFFQLKHNLNNNKKTVVEFDLNKDLLELLAEVDKPGENNGKVDFEWKSVLFVQTYSGATNKIPQKLVDLISTYLYNIPNCIFRHTVTGFFSMAIEPLLQINTVIKLLHILENYNRAVSTSFRIFLNCGLVVVPGSFTNNTHNTLATLVCAAHLLRYAERINEGNKFSGKFLLHADDETIEQLKAKGTSLTTLKNVDVLPGETTNCEEIIWRNPLARITKDQTYMLGCFEIQDALLRHNTYTTYSGFDQRLGRQVIVKVISPQDAVAYVNNEKKLAQLYDSIRSIGCLNHQNIATIFDMGKIDNMLFFVRECVDGQSISGKSFNGEEWEQALLDAMLRIVRALIYIHSHDITHFNLKPGNIWLTEAGGLKITDIRMQGFENDIHTSDLLLPASWRYQAPEILCREKGDVRSDIYSLGIVLYEIIAQCHPYETVGKIETPRDLMKISIASIDNEQRQCHKAWNELITRATHPDADNRFQTFKEMHLALRKIQFDLAPMAEVPAD